MPGIGRVLLCAAFVCAAASSANAMPGDRLARAQGVGDVAASVEYEFVDSAAAYKASFQSGEELEAEPDPVAPPKIKITFGSDPDSGTPSGPGSCSVKTNGAEALTGGCVPGVPEPVMPLLVATAGLVFLASRAGSRLASAA